MNGRNKTFRAAGVLLALLLVFAGLHFGRADEAVTAPDGYDEHDYMVAASFLEQRDGDGVSNGKKLNDAYDPNDPETWVYESPFWGLTYNFAGWTEVEPKRLTQLHLEGIPCVGAFSAVDCPELRTVIFNDTLVSSAEFSGCEKLKTIRVSYGMLEDFSAVGCKAVTSIDLRGNRIESISISNYPKLKYLNLNDNRLSGFEAEDCPLLRDLRLANNLLTELDVSGFEELRELNINGNSLAELDVSSNPRLELVAACDNRFSELDFSGTAMRTQSVKALGPGVVGYEAYFYEDLSETPETHFVHAEALEGYRLAGWFNENGRLISEEADFGGYFVSGYFEVDGELQFVIIPDPLTETGETRFIARFVPEDAEFLLGDCDGSGGVTAADALILFRCASGLAEPGEELLINCDINANGILEAMDALMILRFAMGIS